jgi:peptide/nickel transport system substrate-binding protein
MTVFYASGADLQSINPLVAIHPLAKAVQKHILFLTLARYDSAMRPIPRLAEWEWNEDRTVLTFSLRLDVRWHDGMPTSADDVRWTVEMARAPKVAYPRARDLEAVTEVTVVDSATVRMRFRHTQPTFPDVFTDLAILPAHRFRDASPSEIRRAEFNRHPVGNGPFRFVEYRPNERWVFRRDDGFPTALGRPAIERLVIVVVDEPTTKLAALTSGELDFAGIAPAHAAFVRDDPALRVIDYPVPFVAALVWNLRRPPFDDPVVRRAMTLALDRHLIVDAYLYGYGRVADGPVPPEHPWYDPVAILPHDPPGAEELLERMGWRVGAEGVRERAGQKLRFDLMTVGSGDNALEQMIQAQLGAIGVEVRIRQRELTTFLAVAQGSDRDFDALVTLIPGDLSLGHVGALFGSAPPGPLAYAGYRNPQFDAALERASRATTSRVLRDAWRDAQRILAADHPTTWLYHARGLQGAAARIADVEVDLRGELASVARWRPRSGSGR